MSPQYQAHRAGDKLSPPRKAELYAALTQRGFVNFSVAAIDLIEQNKLTAMRTHVQFS